jgi:hypothetical protein
VLTESFASRCRSLFVAAILGGAAGCTFMNSEPPEIGKPLGYDTVDVPLPGCATRLPPVRDDINCGALTIGKSIDNREVCHLLESLRNWAASAPAEAPSVHPDDWRLVRAVCVSREMLFRAAPADGPKVNLPPVRSLKLEADVPNRSQRMSVRMSEQSRGLEYSVSPRWARDTRQHAATTPRALRRDAPPYKG